MSPDPVLAFEENGWFVFEEFVSGALADDLDGLFPPPFRTGTDLTIIGNEVFVAAGELLFYLAARPRPLDLLEGVMGPFVQIDSFALLEMPSRCNQGISWHRDLLGALPRSTTFEVPRTANLLIYLQDLTPEVGPLRVIPRSHRSMTPFADSACKRPHPDEQLLFLKRGDAVIMHNNLVHSRSPNTSHIARRHVSIVYNHTWMRSSLQFTGGGARALRDRVLATGDRRLSRLVGEDRALDHRINTGFLGDDRTAWRRWLDEESTVAIPNSSELSV